MLIQFIKKLFTKVIIAYWNTEYGKRYGNVKKCATEKCRNIIPVGNLNYCEKCLEIMLELPNKDDYPKFQHDNKKYMEMRIGK